MLTETPLPDWAGGSRVVGVGAQTWRHVDDLGLLTAADGWICAQGKKKLQCLADPDSDLASALAQLVALVNVGVPDRPPAQDRIRPVDPVTDRVLVLTCHEAPATIRVSLAQLTDRLRDWPVAVPLEEAATNVGEQTAWKVLSEHLHRLSIGRHRVSLGETQLRVLLRMLAVRGLDLRAYPEGSDTRAMIDGLGDLLEDPDAAPRLWGQLELIGKDLAVTRSWLERDALVARLERLDFRFTAVARLRRDVRRLRDVASANLAAPPSSTTFGTPDGPVTVARVVSALLRAHQGPLAVTGDPGCGKSVLLHQLAANSSADVVYLTQQQLRGSAGQTRAELNLDHDLAEVLAGWPGSWPGLLLLDGLDQTRGTDASGWLVQLAERLRATRWSIIGSIRRYDLQHGQSWKAMFAGVPVDARHADPTLGDVAHLLVGDLSLEELADVHEASPALHEVARHAGRQLRVLLANPFNLSIAGALLGAGLDVSRIRSRLDLLDRFWTLRVTGPVDGRLRWRVLKTLVSAMVARRAQEVDDDALQDASLLTIMDALLRDGVLRELPTKAWTHQPAIGFAHPVLFDYAAALVALGDPGSPETLGDALDADPDLAMILRPSLDYRLAVAWHAEASHASFWRLALHLTTAQRGHPLAAAAAASVATRELTSSEDLAPLVAACLHADSDAAWSCDDAYTLTFLLAAGLHGGSRQALDAFGHLLQTLAAAAVERDDIGLAMLVAQLGPRATKDALPAAGTPAAEGLVRAAVAAMTVALAQVEEPPRQRVAERAALALKDAAVLDTRTTAGAIRGIMEPEALLAWGVQVIRGPLLVLASITAQDPELGYDLATSLWRLPIGGTGSTNLLGSQILRLTTNNLDELHSARYLVGEAFPAIVAADLLAAARIFTTIVEHDGDYARVPADDGPRPQVRSRGPLRAPGGDELVAVMAKALVNGLDTEGVPVEPAVGILIGGLVRAEVWRLVLHRAAVSTSTELARTLTAALTAPGLFANRQTWSLAGHVVARLTPHLDAELRDAVRMAINAATDPDAVMSASRRAELPERRAGLLNAIDHRGPYVAPPPLADDEGEHGWAGEIVAEPSDELLRSVDAVLQSRKPADQLHNTLLKLWPDLVARQLAEPDPGLICGRLIRAAGRLAGAPQAGPDTDIGQQILTIVQAVLPSADPNTDAETGGGVREAENLATEATATVLNLLKQPAWQEQHGEHLRQRLARQLDSPVMIDRYLSTAAVHLIIPDPDERFARIGAIMLTERDEQVLPAGIQALGRLVHTHPQRIDDLLHKLVQLRPELYVLAPGQDEPIRHDSPSGMLVQCLSALAVRHRTPFAERSVNAWLASPTDHTQAVTLIASQLRDSLNPADFTRRDEQQYAFTLFMQAAQQAHRASRNEDAAIAQNAVLVADCLATHLYHASGAFTAGKPRARGDLSVFAGLALPVLTELSHVRYPAVTHYLVQTAVHLSHVACKDALLLTQLAVTGDTGYISESLGLDAVLDMINQCVAEHRALVLGDPECATAVRALLEQFVRAGWPRAVDMAENLDQLFR